MTQKCPHCGEWRDLTGHCAICERPVCRGCETEINGYVLWSSGEQASNDYEREPVTAGGRDAA